MSALTISALGKTCPDGAQAVRDLDLIAPKGALVSLLCPSGCGATTTLRMAAGFVEPTAGRIEIEGRDLARAPARLRDAGMVFQS